MPISDIAQRLLAAKQVKNSALQILRRCWGVMKFGLRHCFIAKPLHPLKKQQN